MEREMRVDHHLIRRMLETIEAAPSAEIMFMPELTSNVPAQRYHLQLLIDAGSISAQQLQRYRRPCALALTLDGQDLLDKLRRGGSRQRQIWVERLLTASAARLLFGAG
jgi:hypothetical protein